MPAAPPLPGRPSDDRIRGAWLVRAIGCVLGKPVENPQTVASWMGRHLLTFGKYRKLSEITAKIDAVTKDDIISLAERIAAGNLTVAALGDVSGVLPYETLQGKLA